MRRITRYVESVVTITIADDAPADLFTRVHDPELESVIGSGIKTEGDVLNRWAELAAMGYESLAHVDGWADVGDRVLFSVDPQEVTE